MAILTSMTLYYRNYVMPMRVRCHSYDSLDIKLILSN